MTELVVVLDAVYALPGADPVAAVKLAELGGADAVRVGASETLHAVGEAEVHELRRTARCFELALPPTPAALKLALEVRPDRVLLASESRGGVPGFGPLDVATEPALAALLRSLGEAGIPAMAAIAPEVDAVKAAHAAGLGGVEFFTGHAVDLPRPSRALALERLGDASRLAAKMRVPTSLGGGLDARSLAEFAARAPALDRVAVGRALVCRALLVGMERAVRDLRARIP